MLLLSIHPKHVDAILAGTKTVELRRRRPRVDIGSALIYATSPRMELAGMFQIRSVTCSNLESLWQLTRERAAITRQQFDDYFIGLETGVAIQISDVIRFPNPIPLDTLRAEWPGFHPPQGFRYIDWSRLAKLGIASLKKHLDLPVISASAHMQHRQTEAT